MDSHLAILASWVVDDRIGDYPGLESLLENGDFDLATQLNPQDAALAIIITDNYHLLTHQLDYMSTLDLIDMAILLSSSDDTIHNEYATYISINYFDDEIRRCVKAIVNYKTGISDKCSIIDILKCGDLEAFDMYIAQYAVEYDIIIDYADESRLFQMLRIREKYHGFAHANLDQEWMFRNVEALRYALSCGCRNPVCETGNKQVKRLVKLLLKKDII